MFENEVEAIQMESSLNTEMIKNYYTIVKVWYFYISCDYFLGIQWNLCIIFI